MLRTASRGPPSKESESFRITLLIVIRMRKVGVFNQLEAFFEDFFLSWRLPTFRIVASRLMGAEKMRESSILIILPYYFLQIAIKLKRA